MGGAHRRRLPHSHGLPVAGYPLADHSHCRHYDEDGREGVEPGGERPWEVRMVSPELHERCCHRPIHDPRGDAKVVDQLAQPTARDEEEDHRPRALRGRRDQGEGKGGGGRESGMGEGEGERWGGREMKKRDVLWWRGRHEDSTQP